MWSARRGASTPLWYLVLRLGGRALTLYAAQILITMIAIAMLAGAALWRDNPLLLEWHNAAAVFQEPIPTHVGLALLMHQLGYFNILPLYVVLMFMAPLFVLIDRYAPHLVLPVSLADLRRRRWPSMLQCRPGRSRASGSSTRSPGSSFSCWASCWPARTAIGGFARQHIVPIRVIALPIVFCGIFVAYNEWWFDPTRLPNPKLFFLISKPYNTPPRVIQFLALIALFSVTYPYIKRYASRLVDFLSMLGRNSLYVFCVGSVLSLAGQIVRYLYQGNIYSDTAVVILRCRHHGYHRMASGTARRHQGRFESARRVLA